MFVRLWITEDTIKNRYGHLWCHWCWLKPELQGTWKTQQNRHQITSKKSVMCDILRNVSETMKTFQDFRTVLLIKHHFKRGEFDFVFFLLDKSQMNSNSVVDMRVSQTWALLLAEKIICQKLHFVDFPKTCITDNISKTKAVQFPDFWGILCYLRMIWHDSQCDSFSLVSFSNLVIFPFQWKISPMNFFPLCIPSSSGWWWKSLLYLWLCSFCFLHRRSPWNHRVTLWGKNTGPLKKLLISRNHTCLLWKRAQAAQQKRKKITLSAHFVIHTLNWNTKLSICHPCQVCTASAQIIIDIQPL